MKTSLKMLALAAFATFATASCSQKQQDNAEATAENAGDAMENAADNAGNAMENAADNVKADMAREKGDTAVVMDRPANGVVEETPATQK
ncbi:hypothetical protein GCM10023185_40570 [Hymenobacter saemangeumensis]|uniref:YtxH domain-containing protein n=1 Tax=Hymenobacter saemangeumensis TaxID=1084522 RepID=A0ABP8IS53_9BACT